MAELDLASELFHRINRIIPVNQQLLTVPPNCRVRDAVDLMRKHGYSQVPVVQSSEVLGVFSYRSFAKEAATTTLDALKSQGCAPGRSPIMKLYVGLDISQLETAVCIVDHDGLVVREAKVETEPAAILAILEEHRGRLERIGLEACPLSEWLFQELSAVGLPVVCLEVRRLKATLAGAINKTDRADARGIANVVRIGWFRSVHVKSRRSRELRFLLGARKSTLDRLQDAENELRGMLKTFGLRIGQTTRRSFAARVRELLGEHSLLLTTAEPLLKIRAVLLEEHHRLHKMVLQIVRTDALCRRFMTVPGVGPIAALSFKTAIDAPARFSRSRTVGAYLGMTPRRYQSGEIDRSGRISKIGDRAIRTVLFEAATVLLTRVSRWCSLKAWGMRIARRAGLKTAKVAVARKLAVLLHGMWVDGTEFHWQARA